MSKKKLFGGFLLLFLALIVGASIIVALQPGHFVVERSLTMAAPPATVFAQVNDLKAWDGWSPWRDLDPNAKMTFSDPSAGQGASFSWAGNAEVGEGKMTITTSQPDQRVEMDQEFVKPMVGVAHITFTFVPEGPNTLVTWRMETEHGFVEKAACLIMNGKSMVSAAFDKGLASMKSVVEKSAPAPTL